MIRPALPADAPVIAQLIILAMGDLAAKFVNGHNAEQALPLFERFAALTGNQYSFENTLIWEDETGVAGMISGYNGEDLNKLRRPFLEYIVIKYGVVHQIEDETQTGEYYIDCLAVFPGYRGKGIAKKLIKALCDKAASANFNNVGLLVVKSNPNAKKLYIELGFSTVDERTFVGDVYDHLQYQML